MNNKFVKFLIIIFILIFWFSKPRTQAAAMLMTSVPVTTQATYALKAKAKKKSESHDERVLLADINTYGLSIIPQITTEPKDLVLQSATSTINFYQDQNNANPFFDQVSPKIIVPKMPILQLSRAPSPSAANFSSTSPPKAVIGRLNKKTYKSNEKIDLTVTNSSPDKLKVKLTDSDGNEVNSVNISKIVNSTAVDISLSPKLDLRPGKYTLSITDAGGTTTTQDFSWGVLAVNTNKATYKPDEEADISLAVLDERGSMVCDAKVTLVITDPSGAKTTLSTENGKIIVNPQCLSHDFSLIPDYQTSFKVGGEGTYSMQLLSTTKNGDYSIQDSFQVSSTSPFDVERETITRVYPPYSYPVTLNVTANRDFRGTIVEYVPSNFDISPYASGSAGEVISYDSTALPNQFTNMEEAFGTSNLSLSLPFSKEYRQTQGFGVRLTDPKEAPYYASFGLAGHDGLDFAMPIGTPIYAVDSGTVVLAGEGAYGITVVIDHPWGRSYYGHLSKVNVYEGQQVGRGEEIALSGNSGHTTGAHLHFGIKPNNPTYGNGYYGKVDPSPFMGLVSVEQQVLGASSVTDETTNKIIAWNVDVKKGGTFTLGYNFKTPSQSPNLYTIGPLSFFDNTKNLVFKEARSWEVAVDADSSVGPTDCATGADATGIGTATWSSPGNACDSNAVNQATVSLTGTAASHWLKGTMGANAFSIPSTAVIKGIVVSITKTGNTSGSNDTIDNGVRLVLAGVVRTTDRSAGGTWNTSETTVNYGSSSDLWGDSWTPTAVNSSNFGAAISAAGDSGAGNKTITPLVNQIAITVYYNTPPNSPTNDTPTNGQAGVSVDTSFTMHATDDGSDAITYDLLLYSGDASCSTSGTEYDQSSVGTGWDNGTTPYSSGATATFTPPGALSVGTTYSWKVRAKDPSGSNTYGSYSTCTNFSTTSSSGPNLSQLMRHGKYFSSGVKQPFTF